MRSVSVPLMDDGYWAAVPDVLSLEEAGVIVRRTKHTLYRWLNDGAFPAHLIGGVWIVYAESLRRWIEEEGNPHTLPDQFLSRYGEQLSALELSELVGKTRQTVYSWLENGNLVGHRISGRMWLLYKSELIGLLKETSSIAIANKTQD